MYDVMTGVHVVNVKLVSVMTMSDRFVEVSNLPVLDLAAY